LALCLAGTFRSAISHLPSVPYKDAQPYRSRSRATCNLCKGIKPCIALRVGLFFFNMAVGAGGVSSIAIYRWRSPTPACIQYKNANEHGTATPSVESYSLILIN